MTVLIYQLAIIATLILTHTLAPSRLFLASWIWTGLTLLNLFWPPLIIIQLVVIWGTFGLLGKSQKAPSPDVSETDNTRNCGPTGKAVAQSSPASDRPPTHPLPLLPASDKTILGTIQQGASKLAAAADGLNTYVERQRQIQTETSAMRTGYEVERHCIEIALESAGKELQLKRRLDADPRLKKRFEAKIEEYAALLDETRDASTEAGPSEHTCVDFSLPSRHRDPEIAVAIERKYTDTVDDYSTFLNEIIRRLQHHDGLREIFKEKMLSIGGSQILRRIEFFEGVQKAPLFNKEMLSVAALFGSAFNPFTLSPFIVFDRTAKGSVSTDPVSPNTLDTGVRKASESDRPLAKTVAGLPETQFAPVQRDPSISTPVATSAPREQSSPPASAFNANATRSLGPPVHVRQRPSLPHSEREEIKNAAIAMRIPALYHFTRTSNLDSIFKHGLCSISKSTNLGISPHVNDSVRLDGYADAVSLSIAFPNHRMFYKYRQTERNEEWAILAINPVILWSKNCAFCERNAADHRIRERPLADLMYARAFRGMFEMIEGVASREEQGLMEYDPTDPQAEVLVFETIEPDQISSISFDSHQVRNACSGLLGDRDSKVFRSLFGARSFVRKSPH